MSYNINLRLTYIFDRRIVVLYMYPKINAMLLAKIGIMLGPIHFILAQLLIVTPPIPYFPYMPTINGVYLLQ
jgi:hypothetical protein